MPQLCHFHPNVCLAYYSCVQYRSSHTHLLLRKELEIAVVLLQEQWHEERVTKTGNSVNNCRFHM